MARKILALLLGMLLFAPVGKAGSELTAETDPPVRIQEELGEDLMPAIHTKTEEEIRQKIKAFSGLETAMLETKEISEKETETEKKVREDRVKEAQKNEVPAGEKILNQAEPRKEQSVSRSAGARQVEEFIATAYCSCQKCCGKTDGITRMGTHVRKGVIAVDPEVIPLGTQVYIEGMGWFSAEDTGRLIKGKKIDIYMEKHEQALAFGRQTVKIIRADR